MKMRNKYFVIFLVLISSLFIFNCSEIEDEIAQPEELEGVHPDGFGKLGANNFHSYKIQSNYWNMTGCKKCHGADYSGGTTGVSCLDCHTSSAGPEACNTCHGVFADESRIAPPTDLANNYETSAKGVGAHTAHLYENELSLGIGCYECHPGNIGDGNYVAAHSDGIPAEMSLSGYSNMDLTCSNTYCHGNFAFSKEESQNQWVYLDSVIVGNNSSPIWNIVDGTQAACGTCHGKDGTPTPKGHFGSYTEDHCKDCHPNTFNEDGSLNRYTHLDGEKNLN